MNKTTVERVVAIAPHLVDLESTTVDIYIEDAVNELKGTSLADNEKAQRYLAAHLGSLNIRRATSEKVESVSVSYDNSTGDGLGLNSTEYGQEFARIVSNEKGLNFRLFS